MAGAQQGGAARVSFEGGQIIIRELLFKVGRIGGPLVIAGHDCHGVLPHDGYMVGWSSSGGGGGGGGGGKQASSTLMMHIFQFFNQDSKGWDFVNYHIYSVLL